MEVRTVGNRCFYTHLDSLRVLLPSTVFSFQIFLSFPFRRCRREHEHPPEGGENDPEKPGTHSAGVAEYPWQQHPLFYPAGQPPVGHLVGRHRAKDQVQEARSR